MPVIIADPHFHNWAPFSDIENGINSRLQQTINAAKEALDFALSDDKIVLVVGDMFHTRGQLIPSVYNEVVKLWKEYQDKGITFYMIAGNHDSETLNSETDKTAIDSLKSDKCHVVSEGFSCFDLPNRKLWAFAWVDNINELKQSLEACREQMSENDIVMIHASIIGTHSRIWQGLDPEFLYQLPCRFVMAGHIHDFFNYKNKVYSVGSLTQQNMGDMGKERGYLYITSDNKVFQNRTKAPQFCDLTKTDVDNSLVFAKRVKDNFVRITLENVSEEDKKEIEKTLKALKPLKLDIRYSKKTVSARKDVVTTSKVSSTEMTKKYIDKQSFDHKEETIKQASKILEKAGEIDE